MGRKCLKILKPTIVNTMSDNGLKIDSLVNNAFELKRKLVLKISQNELDESFIEEVYKLADIIKKLKLILADKYIFENLSDEKIINLVSKFSLNQFFDKNNDIEQRLSKFLEPLTGFNDDEKWDIGVKVFYSWFSHYDYIDAMLELGVLTYKYSFPKKIRALFLEARNCYAFQQYTATVSLLRTLLENVLIDISKRLGVYSDIIEKINSGINKNKKRFYFNLFLGELFKDKKNTALCKKCKKMYYDTSAVIHTGKKVNPYKAKKYFNEMVILVHNLYNFFSV